MPKELIDSYSNYYTNVRPLISLIELYYKKIPAEILNEIRAFNDHVSKFLLTGSKNDDEVVKAQRHIKRLTLDCFKTLLVYLQDQNDMFQKRTRFIDLTVLNNGDFINDYRRLHSKSENLFRQAKLNESSNSDRQVYSDYELAFDAYFELYEFIQESQHNIKWAKVKHHTSTLIRIVGYIFVGLIGFIIKAFV